jgi:hypothetical protein
MSGINMRGQSAWNMYIFRNGRTEKSSAELVTELANSLRLLDSSHSGRSDLLDALLRAGELECAAADVGSPSRQVLEEITDVLASTLVLSNQPGSVDIGPVGGILSDLERLQLPTSLSVSPPEGFAYYALHPLSYVDALLNLGVRFRNAAVIGIRSIGTTLGAVVLAGLKSMEVNAARTTVRPTGHPYNRVTEFDESQKKWIAQQCAGGAHFFVVDEGPGMSGSSFLSVGDALLKAGVELSKITFLCSRMPDPASLTARDGATRWPAFQSVCVAANRRLPEGADQFIAGGIWRRRVFGDERNWPPSWTQMERLKFLSDDGQRLLKFEGFGRFGKEVHARAQAVAGSQFGPEPMAAEDGFSIYPLVKGELLQPGNLSPEVIARIAEYCAFRKKELRSEAASSKDLEAMLRFNLREEFGGDDLDQQLEIVHPVVADGRMLPHKWLRKNNGELLKVDNASHGDDHFFPGPTDIAWDLAGAIVEWGMDAGVTEQFLNCYRKESGDDPGHRLPAYLLAYSVFRMGYCKMAAEAMRGSSEESRLADAYLHFRQIASQMHERTSVHKEVVCFIPKKDQASGFQIKQLA